MEARARTMEARARTVEVRTKTVKAQKRVEAQATFEALMTVEA